MAGTWQSIQKVCFLLEYCVENEEHFVFVCVIIGMSAGVVGIAASVL